MGNAERGDRGEGAGRRVLVVDDASTSRQIVAAILTNADYAVEEARSGAEAIECLGDGTVDLVVMDLYMPGLDGAETCRRIRQDRRHAFLPIIMITSALERSDRIRSKSAGVDDFLTKPVDPMELLIRARTLLELRDLRVNLNDELERALSHALDDVLRLERLASRATFAAGVGHELNNLLIAYFVWVDEIQACAAEGRAPDPAVAGRLKWVGDHLRAHGKALLRFGRATPQEIAPVSLDGVIAGVLDMFEAAGRTKWVQVRTQFDAAGALVLADRIELEQVVINLIKNSVDAMLGGGQRDPSLNLTTRCTDDSVVCTVEDNGPGVSPENAARAFESYFTTKADGGGTGLGLSVARRIVESAGGWIKLESQVGVGTQVSLSIPRKVD